MATAKTTADTAVIVTQAPEPVPAPVVAPSVPSAPNAIQRLLTRLDALAAKYVTHVAAQAITWITLATHDASKWEASISVLATAVGTGLLRKISAKIQSWGA